MRATTMYPEVEKFARDDMSEMLNKLETVYGIHSKLQDIDISISEFGDNGLEGYATMEKPEDEYSDEVEYIVNFQLDIDGKAVPFELSYIAAEDGYWYTDYDEDTYEDLYRRYTGDYDTVQSSTAIFAADEDDPFADMGFDDEPESDVPMTDSDNMADSIDEMSDTLDDLNDALKDFDEDDIDIETENNISDHYIAECEKCHGVFITAVLESDQEIEKISGVCPLCDEECDQYLKWVIKEL